MRGRIAHCATGRARKKAILRRRKKDYLSFFLPSPFFLRSERKLKTFLQTDLMFMWGGERERLTSLFARWSEITAADSSKRALCLFSLSLQRLFQVWMRKRLIKMGNGRGRSLFGLWGGKCWRVCIKSPVWISMRLVLECLHRVTICTSSLNSYPLRRE